MLPSIAHIHRSNNYSERGAKSKNNKIKIENFMLIFMCYYLIHNLMIVSIIYFVKSSLCISRIAIYVREKRKVQLPLGWYQV